MPNRDFFFYLARSARKLRYYSMLDTLIPLEISHRTRRWCLKCVMVYLARDIPAFVMYCVYGASRSSLLIESIYSYEVYRLYDSAMHNYNHRYYTLCRHSWADQKHRHALYHSKISAASAIIINNNYNSIISSKGIGNRPN